ncbi:MAG TPA: metal-dependent transcriptional regulator [Bdellovibrionota bacterium]|jgi:DtxR family Mn-dependent transcriptional regulator|nr:metal-dependent transcriptional regulator [Bdellovibrionota bacterium]
MGADHDFAVSVENYIKTIWNLEQRSAQPVTNRELSEVLQVTRPSVSQMVQKLEALHLVKREVGARGYRLSAKGQRKALKLLRAHRLVEMFLKKTLGLDGVFLHQEAERLEHAVSERLIDEIDRYLGHPKNDFAGAPIPCAVKHAGAPESFSDQRDAQSRLSGAGPGRYRVVRIHDDSSKLLELLDSAGVGVGMNFEVLSSTRKSVKLSFGGETLNLSLRDAASIEVGPYKL